MKVNRFLHKLYAMLDFGGSKGVDPTPGGFPLIFLFVFVPIMLALILILGYLFL